MSFFERNLAVLKKRYPELARQMELLKPVPAFSSSTIEGEPEVILKTSDGKEFPYHGGESPKKYAKEFVKKLEFKNPRVIIFAGIGLGHHLLEYAKNPQPTNRTVLVLEPFPYLFREALEQTDLTPLFLASNFGWFIGQDTAKLTQFFSSFFSEYLNLSMARAIEYVIYPPAYKLSAPFIDEAQKKILPAVITHQFSRYFCDPYDAHIGYQNTLDNLNLLNGMADFSKAKNAFEGKPGIVVASGPSLNESLPYLKEVQNKAVIAACPSALKVLVDAGIHPHLWLNVERAEMQGKYFEDLKDKPPHVFVGNILVHPRCYTGNHVNGNGSLNSYILGESGLARWVPFSGPRYDHGHSSAHTAFLLLKELGCKSIYLVGQDLSYLGKESHGEGVWDESAVAMAQLQGDEKAVIQLPGNSGSTVTVNAYWYLFLQTFVSQLVPQYAGKVYNVIPSTMGVKINGTERLDPQTLPQQLTESFDVLGILEAKLSPPSPGEQKETREKINAKLRVTQEALKRLKTYASDFALACKQFQFSDAVLIKDWNKAKPVFEAFKKASAAFSAQAGPDGSDSEAKEVFKEFVHPLIQGIFLRGQIDYFGGSGEEEGNFSELQRKAELLYHLAKDEGFWIDRLFRLISSH
ncbi:DUF115 domain-containing protein [bacterium]|nr:DUF115 domain-containing protein [bacterium]